MREEAVVLHGNLVPSLIQFFANTVFVAELYENNANKKSKSTVNKFSVLL